MRKLCTIACFPLLSLAGVTAIARQDPVPYDAVIVGGGPSGLSALSGLARVRRNVLLIDSGEYRNGPTRHMHDLIGFDGVTPAYYRWAAREQLSHYETVAMVNGTVTKIEPLNNNTLFTVTKIRETGEEDQVQARKIVLATGLRDLLPGTPGIEENWGKGIYWCPWCDGHEHADQTLGLLGSLEDAPGLVREILTLNTDLIAFVNGTDTPEVRAATEESFPDWVKFLENHNVTLENRAISSITRLKDGGDTGADPSLPTYPEEDLFRVDFPDGESVERAAFFASFPNTQASSLGEDMGVELWGDRLAVDPRRGLVTNIPGVYAIGDANSDNVTNIPHALFSGKRTAVYLHVQIAREDAAEELAASGDSVETRGLELDPRAIWEEMNGHPTDILHAGEFDQ
ncbi:hypothetical protein DL765_008328 [Monosporascus sp. GIB2]|nr:hypothetical protein DL765_008328 [Monosporascus sp. GIB2]